MKKAPTKKNANKNRFEAKNMTEEMTATKKVKGKKKY